MAAWWFRRLARRLADTVTRAACLRRKMRSRGCRLLGGEVTTGQARGEHMLGFFLHQGQRGTVSLGESIYVAYQNKLSYPTGPFALSNIFLGTSWLLGWSVDGKQGGFFISNAKSFIFEFD